MRQYIGNSVNVLTFVNADKVEVCAEINLLSGEKEYEKSESDLTSSVKVQSNRVFFGVGGLESLIDDLREIAAHLRVQQARFDAMMGKKD